MRHIPALLAPVVIAALLTACGADSGPPQNTNPTLVGSVPADGATGPVGEISLTFSEAMDETSLELSLCTVPDAGGSPTCDDLSDASIAWSEGSTVATYGPVDGLVVVGTSYSLLIKAADEDGNALEAQIGFTASEPLDETPPLIALSSYSLSESYGQIYHSLVFNEQMDRASVELAYSSEPATTCTWRWEVGPEIGQETARCESSKLDENTSYTFTLAKAANDLAGNDFEAPFSIVVYVGDLAPRTISFSPPDGARFVTSKTPIVVTYNESVNESDSYGFYVETAAGQIEGELSLNDDRTEVTFTPDTSYGDGALVSWILDVRGDHGLQAVLLRKTFTTMPVATPLAEAP